MPCACTVSKHTKSGTTLTESVLVLSDSRCAVTDVTRLLKAKTSETSISTKRAENRYIMDLGVTETITIKVVRTEPSIPDDASDDVRDWSNARWIRHVQNFFDGWQNHNYNSGNHLVGGFYLSWSSGDNSGDMFPGFNRNVFLTNGVDCTYGYIAKIGLTFTVGSMQPTSATSTSQRTFKFVVD